MDPGPTSDVRASGNLYRRLGRNIAWLAGGTGAAALLNMLALAFNVRALTAAEFGLLVLLQAAALMLSGLTSFATQQPVIQLGASALAEGDHARLGRIVTLGVTFDLVAAVMASAAAFLTIFLAGDLIGIAPAQRGPASLFAASLLFTGYMTSNGVFRLLDRFALLSAIQAGIAAAILAASALLYAIEAEFGAYVWMWAGFQALNSQLQLWTALRLIRRRGVRLRFDYRGIHRSDVRTFLAYCWTTWGTSSADTLRTNGDSLLVGAIVTVEAAGIYNVAKQVAGILRKLTNIYGSAVFPEVASLSASNSLARARRLRMRMVLAGALIGAIGTAAAVLAGRPLLQLAFGTPFAAGYGALVVLTAAAAGQLISHTFSIYVQVFLGPTKLFVNYMLATLVFIVTAPLLTYWFLATGAALAQLLFSVALILICHLALRASPLSQPRQVSSARAGTPEN